MIDARHHIELDGVTYRIAEDAEGQGHNIVGEPLRPPNAVTVQGETQQTFQPRPDMLLWAWTDWSGGEGQRKFDPQNPNRSWQLNAVRVFEEPGHLIPGYYVEETLVSGGGSAMNLALVLVAGIDKLYGLDSNNNDLYPWDDTAKEWDPVYDMTADGVTLGASDTAVGDNDAIYWVERGTQNLYKYDGTNAGAINSGTLTAGDGTIAQLTDYVYVYRPANAKVWEFPKSGATPVLIDEWTETGKYARGNQMATALDGRLYLVVVHRHQTIIREITPSSAASAGFGSEMARIDGFEADGIWAHSGQLFMEGRYQEDDTDRTVLYLNPGGTFGTLGEIRAGDSMQQSALATGRMLDHFWVQERADATNYPNHVLMQIDAVSGGIAMLAHDETGTAVGEVPNSVVAHRGDIFWSVDHGATDKRVLRADKSRYQSDCDAISPEHDFDIASEKYLGTLVLACEPLPADWTVYVDYQKDANGTWTTGITYTTDNGTGTEVAISTDSSTVQFRSLQLRIRFEYTGVGVPSTAPVVLGVEARAAVTKKVKVFELVLDLADDRSSGTKSKRGSAKMDSFLTTAVKETVLDFKDGYTHRDVNEFDQYDVTVDSYRVVGTRPGEGLGVIVLREVV